MNKQYVQKLQEMITEKLQNEQLTNEQIKELLRILGELQVLKDGLYP
jgi:hypothetical protein